MRTLTFAAAVLLSSFAFAEAPAHSAELVEKGKASFAVNCAPCHGATGHGDGPAAAALNPKPRNFTVEPLKNGELPENVFKTVSEGLKDTAMVPFAHLAEPERWALAYFVVELRAAAKPAAAVEAGKKPAPAKKAAAKK